MQYAWKHNGMAHILDDDHRSLCKAENGGWKPTRWGPMPGIGKKVCANCERLALDLVRDEGPTADEVKIAEQAEIIRLKAKIAVLEKDVERLLGQINPNEELERMAAIRDQLKAPS